MTFPHRAAKLASTTGETVKAILIIADGLGGRPTDSDGKTCLEAALTPHLDELASRGALGLVDPIGPGIRPGSDTGHLSLLGYDPYEVYTGRGVYECLGIGMNVRPGDVCFRANRRHSQWQSKPPEVHAKQPR